MEKLWFLKRIDIMKSLSDEELKDFDRNSFMKNYSKKKLLEIEEGYVYFIKAGNVIIFKEDENKRGIIDILGKGDMFGFLEKDPYEKVQTISETTLCVVKKEYFQKVMEKNIPFNLKVFRFFLKRNYRLEIALSDLLFKNAEERLLSALIKLSERFGVMTKEGFTKIEIPLTHEMIADIVGTSRETISRKISELKKSGKIEVRKKFIIIKTDPENVKRFLS